MNLDPTAAPLADDESEALAEGATWLLDLVAAVDHLRQGARPGITVWDAFAEAVRWTHSDTDRAETENTDLLAAQLTVVLADVREQTAAVLQAAVRRWVLTMAGRYNDGFHWPHPTARRTFPPPLLNHVDS